MKEFNFDDYWKALTPECQKVIAHIAGRVTTTAKTNLNKDKDDNVYDWGGADFLSYIRPPGKAGKEFEKGVSELTATGYSSFTRVRSVGIGYPAAKVSFCYSAFLFRNLLNLSIEQFIVGFYNYTSVYPSHIIFDGYEDDLEKIKKAALTGLGIECPDEQVNDQPNQHAPFCPKLSELIQHPQNDDAGEGKETLSPRDFKSFTLSGRQAEIDLLDDFLGLPEPYKLQFIIAPSGAGKTRLTTEWLCKNVIDKQQWQAGFVSDENMLTKWEDWAKQDLTRDTLIIVDYIYRFRNIVRCITDKGRRHSHKLSQYQAEGASQSVPRLRLIILDHIMPDADDFERIEDYHNVAFGEEEGDILSNLSEQFQSSPIYLAILKKERHEAVLLPIIAQASGLNKEHRHVQLAYDTLKKMDKGSASINEQEESDSELDENTPVFSRFPLFAILIGQALKDSSIEDIQCWQRSKLIRQYFTDKRLPWKNGEIGGQWIGAVIAATTLLQTMPYQFIYDTLLQHGVTIDDSTIKGRCNDITASHRSGELKKYEPDILGESFYLLFFYPHRFNTQPPLQNGQSTVRQVLFALLSGELSLDNHEYPAINMRFIETVQRTARNLANDNQNDEAVRQSWEALTNLLHPDNYCTANMRLSACIACAEIAKTLHKQRNITASPRTTDFLNAAAMIHVAEVFLRLNQGERIVRENGSIWDICLSTLSQFADISLALLGKLPVTFEQTFKVCLEQYEQHSPTAKTLLFFPAYHNTPALLNWLLSEYPEKDVNQPDKEDTTALMFACLQKHHAVVAIFASHSNINYQGASNWTVLMVACQSGDNAMVKALLEYKPNLDLQKNGGWTALMFACRYGGTAMVKALLRQEPNLDLRDDEQSTALMLAARRGNTGNVKAMIEAKAALNSTDSQGRTALWHTAGIGRTDCAKALIEAGAALDLVDNRGWSALMIAIKHHNTACVKALIEAKAALDLINAERESITIIAVRYGDIKGVVKIMIEAGVASDLINDSRGSALREIIRYGLADILAALIQSGVALDWADGFDTPPLIEAVHCKKIDCLKALIDGGAALNLTDYFRKESALILAAKLGKADYVTALINAKAALNLTDKDGRSALMHVASLGEIDCVKALIKAKAALDLTDDFGMSALLFAEYNGHSDCVKEFRV